MGLELGHPGLELTVFDLVLSLEPCRAPSANPTLIRHPRFECADEGPDVVLEPLLVSGGGQTRGVGPNDRRELVRQVHEAPTDQVLDEHRRKGTDARNEKTVEARITEHKGRRAAEHRSEEHTSELQS